MKVLVTGHRGYIGSVLVPLLVESGHEVAGLDTGLYEACGFGDRRSELTGSRLDIRDVGPRHLDGFEAVVHLAALSNDPVGDLDPQLTYDINHVASVRLARAARAAGVERFLFASSCSLYGAGDARAPLTEGAAFNPLTPYGESKILVERDVRSLATASFSPVFLRNATAYGVSPSLRVDIMVNNLVGYAVTTGEVLITSDGSPWRPLVHVEDICRAVLASLEADRQRTHNQAFNVGLTEENFRVREVAEMVESVTGSRVELAAGASADARDYRVDFGKIRRALPELRPRWTVRKGIEELYEAYLRYGMTADQFLGGRFTRLAEIQRLQAAGRLDDRLRWTGGHDG
ncbi:MAG TPA: SDR family oxidoreductase [Acidimicrobiales bacterium]